MQVLCSFCQLVYLSTASYYLYSLTCSLSSSKELFNHSNLFLGPHSQEDTLHKLLTLIKLYNWFSLNIKWSKYSETSKRNLIYLVLVVDFSSLHTRGSIKVIALISKNFDKILMSNTEFLNTLGPLVNFEMNAAYQA